MPTQNRRVAAYLPPAIEAKFNQFKEKQRIGDSEALIAILSAYFGVESNLPPADLQMLVRQIVEETLEPHLQQIDSIAAKVDRLTLTSEPKQPALSEFFNSTYEKHYGNKKR